MNLMPKASGTWTAGPSQDTQHEVTWSITTPPGWNASPSQDTQHEVTRSISIPPLPRMGASPSQGYPQQYRVDNQRTKRSKVSCLSITKTVIIASEIG